MTSISAALSVSAVVSLSPRWAFRPQIALGGDISSGDVLPLVHSVDGNLFLGGNFNKLIHAQGEK